MLPFSALGSRLGKSRSCGRNQRIEYDLGSLAEPRSMVQLIAEGYVKASLCPTSVAAGIRGGSQLSALLYFIFELWQCCSQCGSANILLSTYI